MCFFLLLKKRNRKTNTTRQANILLYQCVLRMNNTQSINSMSNKNVSACAPLFMVCSMRVRTLVSMHYCTHDTFNCFNIIGVCLRSAGNKFVLLTRLSHLLPEPNNSRLSHPTSCTYIMRLHFMPLWLIHQVSQNGLYSTQSIRNMCLH